MNGQRTHFYQSSQDYGYRNMVEEGGKRRKVGAGSYIVPIERCLEFNNQWQPGFKVVKGSEGDAFLLQCTSTTIILNKKQLEVLVTNSKDPIPGLKTPACLRSKL